MNVPAPQATVRASSSTTHYHRHGQDKRRRRSQAGLLDRVANDRAARKGREMATSKAEQDGLFSRAGFSPSATGIQRMFLALQSTILDEVDWALTGLLHLSRERGLLFKACPGSAEAVLAVIEDWIRSTQERYTGTSRGLHLFDHADRESERRASTATLVLVNSLAEHEDNRRILSLIRCRPSEEAMLSGTHQATTPVRILTILDNVFGQLSAQALLEISSDIPEPITHLLEILRMLLPYFVPSMDGEGKTKSDDPLTAATVSTIVTVNLANIFGSLQDHALITSLLTIFLSAAPVLRPPLSVVTPKLRQLLLLGDLALPDQPYSQRLSVYCLMFLYDLSQIHSNSLTLLASPDLGPLLRCLLPYLTFGAKSLSRTIQASEPFGVPIPLMPNYSAEYMREGRSLSPAVLNGMAQMDEDGTPDCMADLGYGERIPMEQAERTRLRALTEPRRVREWLETNFVHHPKSMITQVIYWNEYREFTTSNPAVDGNVPIPRASVAAEVIPALTQVFTKCSAVVMSADAHGNPLPAPKYVVKGLMFRRYLNAKGIYRCKWSGCLDGFGMESADQLLQHIVDQHLSVAIDNVGQYRCRWLGCGAAVATEQHLGIHVPSAESAKRLRGGKHGAIAIMHPATDTQKLDTGHVTQRRPPPLPSLYPVLVTKLETPVDERDWPKGEGYWAALILRNLARTLRQELEAAELDQMRDLVEREAIRRSKNRNKVDTGEYFGLPIPESVGKDQANASSMNAASKRLTEKELDKARGTFTTLVEGRALSLIEERAQVAMYLLECVHL